MSRLNPKGKGKGAAHPRHERFDDFEDDRPSPRGYPIGDPMEEDYGDDRRDDLRSDRGGDLRSDRGGDLRSDRGGDRRGDYRGPRRDDPRDDNRDGRREPRRDDNRDQDMYDRQDDRREDVRREDVRREDVRREDVDEGWITQYFPTSNIEWEVIAGDIQIYLGPEASVRMGPDPDDSRRMAYWVKAKNNTLTKHMLSDLMADSIAWKNEKSRDRNSQSYFDTQTHREREKRGPSRRLPVAPSGVPRPDPYDLQPTSTPFTSANRAAMGTSPPAPGNTFAQSMNQTRDAALVRPQDQSFLTRGEAEQIIARRLRDGGKTRITKTQLEYLIDEALGSASATQEQFLTREQAQKIIVQRLKAAGKTTVTKSQLEGLINQKVEESKQENIERVVDEAIQKGHERPVANQGRPTAQAAPPNRPPPRNPNPDGTFGQPEGTYGQPSERTYGQPEGTFGHPDTSDYSRHKKPS